MPTKFRASRSKAVNEKGHQGFVLGGPKPKRAPVYKLVENFVRLATENPEGFTMNLQGKKVERDSGYAVALTPVSFRNVLDAINRAIAPCVIKDEAAIGYWRDPETGEVYIDVVALTEYERFALMLGRIFQQKAIYSFRDKKEVYLDACAVFTPASGRNDHVAPASE